MQFRKVEDSPNTIYESDHGLIRIMVMIWDARPYHVFRKQKNGDWDRVSKHKTMNLARAFSDDIVIDGRKETLT